VTSCCFGSVTGAASNGVPSRISEGGEGLASCQKLRQHAEKRSSLGELLVERMHRSATLKAAVVHYTRCLAKELIDDGVRINAVSPGATKTARFQASRVVDPERMDSSKKSLNRYAEPEEIAEAVAFLAGPRARFINGQIIRVDGGFTIFPG
jgi:NAD(P)-dependent dehydrogenase (short-subunit alcohol dehydrogenase family)